MAYVLVPLCSGCGRADQPLVDALEDDGVNGGQRLRRRYKFNPALIPRGHKLQIGVTEEQYQTSEASYCPQCTKWATVPSTAGKYTKFWDCAWPAITAYLLGTDQAQYVWCMLPCSVRWTWRALVFDRGTDDLCVLDFDCPNRRLPGSDAFPENASWEALRNTKCAACRRALCPEEVEWVPLHVFEECKAWHAGEIKHAVQGCLMWNEEDRCYCGAQRMGRARYCNAHVIAGQPNMCNAITSAGTPCCNRAGNCQHHSSLEEDDEDSEYRSMLAMSTACQQRSRRLSGSSSVPVVADVEDRAHSGHGPHDHEHGSHSSLAPDRNVTDVSPVVDSQCIATTARGTRCLRRAAENGRCALHRQWVPRRPHWDAEYHGLSGMGPIDEWLVAFQDAHARGNEDEHDSTISFHSSTISDGMASGTCGSEAGTLTDSVIYELEDTSGSDSEVGDAQWDQMDILLEEAEPFLGSENAEYVQEADANAHVDDEGANEMLDAEPGEGRIQIPTGGGHDASNGESQKQKRRNRWTLHPGWDNVCEDPLFDEAIATRVSVRPSLGLCIGVCGECKGDPRHHLFSAIWPKEGWFPSVPKRGLIDYDDVYEERTFDPPVHDNLFWLSPVRICESALSGTVVRSDADGQWRNPRYQMLALTGDGRGVSTQYVSLDTHPAKKEFYSHGCPHNRGRHIQTILHHRRDLHPFFARTYGESVGQHSALTEALTEGFLWNIEEAEWLADVQVRNAPAVEMHDQQRQHAVMEDGPPGWVAPRTLPRIGNGALAAALHVIMQLRFARGMLLQREGVCVLHVFSDMQWIVRNLLRGGKPLPVLHKELLADLRADTDGSDHLALSTQEGRCAVTMLRAFLCVLHTEAYAPVQDGRDREDGLVKYYNSEFFGHCRMDHTRMSHSNHRFDPPCIYHHRARVSDGACHMQCLDAALRRLPARSGWVRGPELLVWFDGTGVDTILKCALRERVLDRYVLRAIVERIHANGTWQSIVVGRQLNGSSAWAMCTEKEVVWLPSDWQGHTRGGYLLVFENTQLLVGRDFMAGVQHLHQEPRRHTINDACIDSSPQVAMGTGPVRNMDIDVERIEIVGLEPMANQHNIAFDPFSYTEVDMEVDENMDGNDLTVHPSLVAGLEPDDVSYDNPFDPFSHGHMETEISMDADGTHREVEDLGQQETSDEHLDAMDARMAFDARLPGDDDEASFDAKFVGGVTSTIPVS